MADIVLNNGSVNTYADLASFPPSAPDGALGVDRATDSLYEFDGDTSTWMLIGPGGGGGGGSGTVTSVAVAVPAEFTVSGSPVTTSGTITISKSSESANTVWAAPDGLAGVPTFRALLAADVPTLPQSKITNLVSDLAAKAFHVLPATNEKVYVNSTTGSNATGDGSYDKPWATVAFAMTQITDASINKAYTINITGRQVETTDVLMKPYVFIVGDVQRASYIRINGGAFKPHSSWGTGTAWAGFSDIYIGGSTTINFDLQAVGGSDGLLILNDVTATGSILIKGRNGGGGDYLEVYNSVIFSTLTLDSVNSQLQSTEFVGLVTFTDTQAAGSTYTVDFSNFNQGFTTGITGSLNQVSYASGCDFITTAAVSVDSFHGLPPKASRTLFAGTTVTDHTDATMVPYTPTTPANWSVTPTDVQEALDTLAAAIPTSSYKVNTFTLNGTDISNKFVTLASAPANPTLTVLEVVGGGVQQYTADFSVSGSTLSWSGLFLDGVLASGDVLIVQFY